MPANFCFQKLSTRRPALQHGFTLIELMVVVVIVAILFTYTTLAIRGDSPEDLIKQEAQKMERLIQLALEESILRGEEYAIEVNLDSYRFLRLIKNQWQPVTQDKLLRERELPPDMELEMLLEDTEIVIDNKSSALSSTSMPEQILDLGINEPENDQVDDESENEQTQEDQEKNNPQIYLLSSGEITPEFDIRFYILGIETSYIVKGFFDGTVKTEISDL